MTRASRSRADRIHQPESARWQHDRVRAVLHASDAPEVPARFAGLHRRDPARHADHPPRLRSSDVIASAASRYDYAQTVCTPGFYDALPPMRSGLRGLFLADTSHYYPEDRSISESLGWRACWRTWRCRPRSDTRRQPHDQYRRRLVPLVVDLDGTLLRADLLHESALRLVSREPWRVFQLPLWLGKGKAQLKRQIAERVDLDVDSCPSMTSCWPGCEASARPAAASSSARPPTTSSCRAWSPTTSACSTRSSPATASPTSRPGARRKRWVARFGARASTTPATRATTCRSGAQARRGVVVTRATPCAAAARAAVDDRARVRDRRPPACAVVAALRLHQWAKNLLVFLPLLASHRYGSSRLLGSDGDRVLRLRPLRLVGLPAERPDATSRAIARIRASGFGRSRPERCRRRRGCRQRAPAVGALLLAGFGQLAFVAWLAVYLG